MEGLNFNSIEEAELKANQKINEIFNNQDLSDQELFIQTL